MFTHALQKANRGLQKRARYLQVVASSDGDDTVFLLQWRQVRDFVVRAADIERKRGLHVLSKAHIESHSASPCHPAPAHSSAYIAEDTDVNAYLTLQVQAAVSW